MLTVRDLRRPGLDSISLQLERGECLAVQGPSGSGKSLLLRAIADLDPNTGEVLLDGESREAMPAPDWRRRVVYVPSESGWWGREVGEHFSRWDLTRTLLEPLGLPEAVRDWPIQRLSTGERQRLALIRAIILEPRILLLDEPTSGLDAAAVTAVEEMIKERLRSGMAALWVTHDAAQAGRMAERCLFLDHGRAREERL